VCECTAKFTACTLCTDADCRPTARIYHRVNCKAMKCAAEENKFTVRRAKCADYSNCNA
jgi:hypothetical protein